MIDFGFDLPPRKHYLNDLNIVPILDMFIAVIFFLLLTTTFMGLTKLQVPPAAVSTINDPVMPPPISAKLYLWAKGDDLFLSLRWSGQNPGEKIEKLSLEQVRTRRSYLLEKSKMMLAEFKAQFPSERTLQLSLDSILPFQMLIELMDSAREVLPDMVLLSPDELAVVRTGGL